MSRNALRFMTAICALGVTLASAAAAAPQRVMSINMCADQLILSLLPPSRIASVTWLSRRSYNSAYAAEAARVAVNYGSAEEVLAQKPDLVIAGKYSTPATRKVLEDAHTPLLELALDENNFDAIRATTRQVARAVGAVARGEDLIRAMDATLAELSATAPPQKIRVALWSGDRIPGKDSLSDSILRMAGGVNIAAALPEGVEGTFDIEELLAAQPDILAYGDSAIGAPGLVADRIRHRVLRRFYANRQIVYPQNLYNCGSPKSAEAASLLRQAMRKAMANERAAP